ncbi:MAG: hypothetical protein FWF44_05100 [Defluviitaleaceae bacterium]|nr:hypothetical protein [Defluviitaleaceae bacterium]
MEAIRQVVDGNLLSSIIELPKNFQNRKVEVLVFPVSEDEYRRKKVLPIISEDEFEEMFKGSITESLVGAVPDSGKTLDEYREERRECRNFRVIGNSR